VCWCAEKCYGGECVLCCLFAFFIGKLSTGNSCRDVFCVIGWRHAVGGRLLTHAFLGYFSQCWTSIRGECVLCCLFAFFIGKLSTGNSCREVVRAIWIRQEVRQQVLAKRHKSGGREHVRGAEGITEHERLTGACIVCGVCGLYRRILEGGCVFTFVGE